MAQQVRAFQEKHQRYASKGNSMTARALPKSRAPKSARKRKTRQVTPVRRRENTSTIVLYPHQVADELLVSEDEVYRQMALGIERGGLRAICLGDPNSARPRKVVHRDDFALWIEYKRGLCSLAEYVKRAGGKT
jgi:hypothetical protein